MDNPYLEQFLSECFDKESKHYLIAVQAHLKMNLKRIQSMIKEQMSDFFQEVMKIQKEENQAVGYISISFLYTSVYFKKPVFRLDAYTSEWYLEESLLTKTIDAGWMFEGWEDSFERMQVYLKESGRNRFIRTEQLRGLTYRTVKQMILMSLIIYKYMMPEIAELPSCRQLRKSESFYITYGEYLDWQRIIYAELPQIDILKSEPEVSRTFRLYQNCAFKKENFNNYDTSNSLFQNCKFRKCQFSNLKFNDTVFENCIFETAEFDDMELFGVSFVNCNFTNIKAQRLYFRMDSQRLELYKNADFIDCRLEEISIQDSDLSDIDFAGCFGKSIVTENCMSENSNFDWYYKTQAQLNSQRERR